MEVKLVGFIEQTPDIGRLPNPNQPDPGKVDYEKSLKLGQDMGFMPKLCYQNAISVLLLMYGRPRGDSMRYVEGGAVSDLGIGTPHGWIVDGDTILDPTWALVHSKTGLESCRYFTGVSYTVQEVYDIFWASVKGDYDLILPLSDYEQGAEPRVVLNLRMNLALRSANLFGLDGDSATIKAMDLIMHRHLLKFLPED